MVSVADLRIGWYQYSLLVMNSKLEDRPKDRRDKCKRSRMPGTPGSVYKQFVR